VSFAGNFLTCAQARLKPPTITPILKGLFWSRVQTSLLDFGSGTSGLGKETTSSQCKERAGRLLCCHPSSGMEDRPRTKRQLARLKNSLTQLKKSTFSRTTLASFKTRFSVRSLAFSAIRTEGGVKKSQLTLQHTSLKVRSSQEKT
jgi:hypothetical protein